jgi:hypothetical protein
VLVRAFEVFCLYGANAGFVGCGDVKDEVKLADPVLWSLFPFWLKEAFDNDLISKVGIKLWVDEHPKDFLQIIEMKETKQVLELLLEDDDLEYSDEDDEDDE